MRHAMIRWGVSLVVVAAMVLVRVLLDPLLGDRLPFLTLLPAIAFVAWSCGRGPGLLATLVGPGAVAYFILEPRGSFAIHVVEHRVGLVLYGLFGLGLLAMFGAMRTASRQVAEQRERLRTTLSSIGDAVIATDAVGRVTTMNAVAESLTGWKSGEATGRPLDDVFSIMNEGSRERVENPVEKVLREGLIVGLANHTVLIAKDGTERPIDDRAAPIRCANGDIVGCVLVFRDVTERLQAERALSSLAAIVESSHDAIIAKDTNGIITSWNRTAERLFGYSAAEAVGQSIAMLAPPDRADEMPALLARLRRGEQIDHFDTVRRAKDGRLLPISLTISPIRDRDGRIVGASKIARDISERKRLEAEQHRQREYLRVTLASIGDAVITTDVEGRIDYMNAVAESLTGWTLADAVGTPLDVVFDIVNEDTRETVENPAKRSLREGVIVGLANHTVLIAKDGTERPIDDSAAPIRDAQGHMLGCVLIFRDVSERRRVEQELADEKTRIESMVNHAVDGIIAIDADGTVEAFNPAAERLFGHRSEDVIGRNVKMLMPEPFRGEHDDYLANYYRTGQAKVIGIGREVEGLRKDGTTFPMDLAVSEFWLGKRRYFTGLVRDITERRRTEDHVNELLVGLKEGDRRKDEFLAILAHELRGPLAPLSNTLEIMKRAADDASVQEVARNTMERQLRHLVRLVDDLIDISRITRDRIELRKARTELASVLHQSIEACRPLAERGGLDVTVALPTEPIYLQGDAVRLVQVFGNILNNACKYTPEGGRIQLTAERQGSEAVVSVRDTGVGIPSEGLATVFEMFTQIDHTRERAQGGLGIGLTLVKRLVQMHGGSVEALSEGPGQGSEFVVRLPLLAEASAGVSRENMPGPAPMEPRRILVVDDNPDATSSLAMLLRLGGHETHVAHDGLEAVDAARRLRPDVVLLDIGLPGLNGYDVCRRIRQQPDGKRMLIVALTGWGQNEDRLKSKDASFDGHLVKPVNVADLERTLASHPVEDGGG